MGENAKLYSTVFALRLNLEMAAYHRQTTFQQSLFELVEQLGNVSEACRCGKKRIAQWIWKGHCTRRCLDLPVFIKGGNQWLDGLSK